MMNMPRRKRWNHNSRLIQQDIIETSNLLKSYTEFLHEMVTSMATLDCSISTIFCRLDIMPSKMDAILYKLDEFQRTVMTLQSSLYGIQGMQHSIDPLVSSIASINETVQIEFCKLQLSIASMNSIVKNLDEIAKDPVINRTIEDLKEVSDRF